MLNMKYYRKLNREDPQKAKDYRDRCIASKDILDKHWYKPLIGGYLKLSQNRTILSFRSFLTLTIMRAMSSERSLPSVTLVT